MAEQSRGPVRSFRSSIAPLGLPGTTDEVTVRICVLGPLRVELDDEWIDVGGQKVQTVLTALILARSRVVSTDRLVELIWAGQPPAKPYVTVRSYISHLRRVLEPNREAGDRARLVVTRSPGYALEIDDAAVDAFAFEALLEGAAAAIEASANDTAIEQLDQALGLWASDDLSDSPLSPYYGEVERLLELRRRAVGLRYDALLSLGHHEGLIPDLRSLVEANPAIERYRAQLMLALYRTGRQAEAIEVHQAGVRAAIETTGLDVSPALVDLERRILANDPSLDWVAPQTEAAAPLDQPEPIDVEPIGPIGRDDEAAAIRQAIDDCAAVAGSTTASAAPALVVVTGEPGIGKSTLLAYGAAHAERSGFVTATGFGHDGNRTIPLAPWRQVLTDLVEDIDDDDELASLIGNRGGHLAQLVSELTDRLGIEPKPAPDPAILTDGVARFIQRLADRKPMLIQLEDLHWFDLASVQMATQLLARLQGHPVIMTTSWRDTESGVDDDVQVALADLGASGAGRRLHLKGLELAAVARLWSENGGAAGERAGGEPGRWPTAEAPEPRDIHRRTGGNPLFVLELIRASGADGPLIASATVRDVIASRLAGLPGAAHQLLSIGSLCPGSFDLRLLTELSDLDPDELLDNVDQLLNARLIDEDPRHPGRFSFSHSLIGESLAAQMSGVRKARLHNLIAVVLGRQEAPIGELAHHFLQGAAAGDPYQAANAALEAARSASRLHHHDTAIDLIERGLTVLDRSDDDLLRAKLMIDLAQSRKFMEHITQSHAAAQEGFRLAKRAGDLELMVVAAGVFCGQSLGDSGTGLTWLGYWNPPGPALDMLNQCLEKLPPGQLRVVVLLAYASELFGEYDNITEAIDMSAEAVAEARQTPNLDLLAAALLHQLNTLQRRLPYERRRDLITESLDVALSARLVHREIAARRSLMVLRLDEGNIDGARAEADTCKSLTDPEDDPHLAIVSDSMTIALDLYQGRLDDAQAGIDKAFSTYQQMGTAALDVFGIQLSTLRREQGALHEVEAMLRWKLTGYPGPAYGTPLAMVLAEQGRHDEARQVLAEYSTDPTLNAGEGVLQYMTLAFEAETAAILDDRGRAEPLYGAMSDAAGRTVAMFNGMSIYGSGSYYLGRLATVLGLADEARAHFEQAIDDHRRVGSRPYEIRTLIGMAVLERAEGDLEAANRLMAEAEAAAAGTQLTWLCVPPDQRQQG